MEEAAKRGVRCRLPNQNNEEIERLLFPRLSSMNFDQPEAQLFFGLQNKFSCSKCRSLALIMKSYLVLMISSDVTLTFTIRSGLSGDARVTARSRGVTYIGVKT